MLKTEGKDGMLDEDKYSVGIMKNDEVRDS